MDQGSTFEYGGVAGGALRLNAPTLSSRRKRRGLGMLIQANEEARTFRPRPVLARPEELGTQPSINPAIRRSQRVACVPVARRLHGRHIPLEFVSGKQPAGEQVEAQHPMGVGHVHLVPDDDGVINKAARVPRRRRLLARSQSRILEQLSAIEPHAPRRSIGPEPVRGHCR